MMKRLGAVLVLVLISGCGDAIKELMTQASCNNATAGVCWDYSGPSGTSLTRFETTCATSLGNNSSAACTGTNRIASCSLSPFTGVSQVIRYYSGTAVGWTLTTAAANCTAAGAEAGVPATFTPN